MTKTDFCIRKNFFHHNKLYYSFFFFQDFLSSFWCNDSSTHAGMDKFVLHQVRTHIVNTVCVSKYSNPPVPVKFKKGQ